MGSYIDARDDIHNLVDLPETPELEEMGKKFLAMHESASLEKIEDYDSDIMIHDPYKHYGKKRNGDTTPKIPFNAPINS